MDRLPERLLPIEPEVMDYIEGFEGMAVNHYRIRCGVPHMDHHDALCMFLDGMRQLGLLKPGETKP